MAPHDSNLIGSFGLFKLGKIYPIQINVKKLVCSRSQSPPPFFFIFVCLCCALNIELNENNLNYRKNELKENMKYRILWYTRQYLNFCQKDTKKVGRPICQIQKQWP